MTLRNAPFLATALVLFASAVVGAQPAPPPGGGPMLVERVNDGFAVEPEVKFTNLDGTTRTLAGVSGGWMFDNTLLIGIGGDWLADGGRGRDLAYGGLVVQWLHWTDRPVGFSFRGLLGGGTATLSDTLAYGYSIIYGRDEPPGRTTATFLVRRDVLVAEPQADLLLNLGSQARLKLGAGYRLVGADGDFDRRLRGATGSISFQLGGSRTRRP